MQSGTVAAFINQFARQVFISADLALDTTHLNGIIVVDNSNNPVAISLPPADNIRAGGYFMVFALTDANPVTVSVRPGDNYNAGEVAPIVLTGAGEILTVFATNQPNRWGVILSAGSGGCCAPAIQPNWQPAAGIVHGVPLIALPDDSVGNVLSALVHCIDDGATAEWFRDSSVDPGDPIPIVTNVEILRDDPPIADTLEVTVDVPAGTPGGGQLHLVIKNPCGCCAIWPGPFDISGG